MSGVTKKCPKCNKPKPLSDYIKGNGKCKPCRIAYLKAYREKNKEKLKEKRKKYLEENEEKVREQQKRSYHKHKEKRRAESKAYYHAHKEEARIKGKEWREKNKEQQREYKKKRYLDNREEICRKRKEYVDKNREEVNRKKYEAKKRKLKTDVYFRIRECLQNRMYHLLSGNKRCDSYLKLVGVKKWDELWGKLEPQFYGEICWDNYGEVWEIHHVKAGHTFDMSLPESQYECFNYLNLQPLTKVDHKKIHSEEKS